MLREPTVEQLRELKLLGMLAAWEGQSSSPDVQAMTFDERFGLIVDAESLRRQDKRLERYLKEAKLKLPMACIEDISYASERHLDRATIRQLATCRWVDEHLNILITGATGTGKTFIACALAQKACRQGFRALYRRVPRLIDELAIARLDGSLPRLLARFARIDVLVLDDWAIAPIRDAERRDLLEVIEDRSEARSTIVTSQLPVDKWHDHVGDPTTADAICDRLIHSSHRLVLQGPSRRKENAKKSKP